MYLFFYFSSSNFLRLKIGTKMWWTSKIYPNLAVQRQKKNSRQSHIKAEVRGCFRTLYLFQVHSLSQRPREFLRGVGACVNWNFCSSAWNGFQTCRFCVPFHGIPFFFFASFSSLPFLFSFLFFGLNFRAPIKSQVGVKEF